MASNTGDDPPSPSPDDVPAPENDRYAHLELVDGAIVIYDLDDHRAWIQSDSAVDPTALA